MRKDKAPAVLIFSLSLLLLSGCYSIKPTYTKEKIVEAIASLCKEEYKVEPKVWLLGETVWVYLPIPRLITEDKKWDKDTAEKINKVIVGSSRVILSMKPRPQFMVVVTSDTQDIGLDYAMITWIPDIVKFQLQFISRDEFFRRTVILIKENPQALNDTQGLHIEKREVKMPEFLAEQIAQRTYSRFGMDPKLKDYFQVEAVEGIYRDNTFVINAKIKETGLPPEGRINIIKEIVKIINYVVKQYEFKDFLLVEMNNPPTNERLLLSRSALVEYH